MCRTPPYRSCEKGLVHLPLPTNRTVAARVRDITVAPRAGTRVQRGESERAIADYVLVLIAVTEKSSGKQMGSSYRVITKNVLDCDIWKNGSDIPMTADCVSICTDDNLLNYKLVPPKHGGHQYAIALVSGCSLPSESSKGSYMIDVVESIDNDVEVYKRMLRKLLTLAKGATFSSMPTKRTAWPSSCSPLATMKAKKLARYSTDASLPDTAPPI